MLNGWFLGEQVARGDPGEVNLLYGDVVVLLHLHATPSLLSDRLARGEHVRPLRAVLLGKFGGVLVRGVEVGREQLRLAWVVVDGGLVAGHDLGVERIPGNELMQRPIFHGLSEHDLGARLSETLRFEIFGVVDHTPAECEIDLLLLLHLCLIHSS